MNIFVAVILGVIFPPNALAAMSMLNQNSIKESISECMIKGVEYYAPTQKTIFVSVSVSKDDYKDKATVVSKTVLLSGISRRRLWKVLVVNPRKTKLSNSEDLSKSLLRMFIVYFHDRGEIEDILNRLEKESVLNPHAKFLVASPMIFENNSAIAEEVFVALAKRNVLNAVLLLADHLNIARFEIYSWFPFEEGDCNQDKIDNLNLIDNCTYGHFERNASWYTNKVPARFKKCTMLVVYARVPPYVLNMDMVTSLEDSNDNHGVEISLIRNLAKMLNISLVFQESPILGTVYRNGTATGNPNDMGHLYLPPRYH
ncbi:uncharacterized protein LOC132704906 [Cylas formicarius]|uniref:uncharacterized protein LOC132704906 n=1 Tax=Cylas formicarius TaxID=197179 RepID=UPI00295893D2|nr:uncharacterized protein LOC132704906 [Cylas formicarius]